MKKRILALLLVLILCLGLAACGSTPQQTTENTAPDTSDTDSQPSGTEETPSETAGTVDQLTIAITKDENTLAPFTYVSSTGLTVNRLIYDTLFTIDLQNNVVPWMVEDDYTVENNQVYTVKLREGQTFHNGDPVNAEAIVFSFTYPADQTASGYRKIAAALESVEAVDELTVRFTLKEPDVNFLRDGLASMRIICPSVYEGVADGSTITDSIGSGPYRLAEYKTGESYVLEAVDGYFKGTPRVKTIRMPILSDSTAIQQALLAGELDASTGTIGPEMVDTFSARSHLRIFSNAGYAPTIVNFNCGRYPFDQADFRKAISYAVDVEGICNTLYGDYALTGTPGLIRSDLPYAADVSYTYDPEQAVALLEGLGFTEVGKDGIRLDSSGEPLSFEILTYSGNATRSRLCELMKEQLKEVGIQLEIVSLDMDTADAYIWPDFEVSKGRDYDLSTWGWGTSAGNSYTYLISLCHSDFVTGNLNVCGYRSERFDTLVEETKAESTDDMEQLLLKLQQVVAEEVPLLTIGFADSLQVCNTARFDGWQAGKGANVVNIYSFLPA